MNSGKHDLTIWKSDLKMLEEIIKMSDAYSEEEFTKMVEKGTKAWEGVPDDWVDNLRGNDMETELVLVECIQTYRMRYMVEVPVGRAGWALDTVSCDEAKEFSQLSLGETIVSHISEVTFAMKQITRIVVNFKVDIHYFFLQRYLFERIKRH